MIKRRQRLFLLSALAMTIALARGDDTFLLQPESNRVTLIAGPVTVQSHPDSLLFVYRGPYGSLHSSMGNEALIHLASINVTQNDGEAKRVTLRSHPTRLGEGTHQFAVTLEAWRDHPGVRITVQGNVGFFKLCPILADYYADPEGDQHAARDKIPVTPWMFWPTSNTTGGYGIVFSEPDCIRMITLHPRADWRQAGWYLMPAPKPDADGRLSSVFG